MSDAFKPGDIVVVKSGGPKMTIGSVSGSEAYCVWFDSDYKPSAQHFPLTVLKAAQ